MFNILKRWLNGEELITSQLFDEQTFNQALCRDIKKARKAVVIESPYLTERRARYFSGLLKKAARRRVKIRVNTRHPRYHSYEMGTQAKLAAKILLESGVKIYTYSDLRHRKLVIIDKKILWEGSMNILSHNRSREIMRRSASSRLCREMIRFLNIYN